VGISRVPSQQPDAPGLAAFCVVADGWLCVNRPNTSPPGIVVSWIFGTFCPSCALDRPIAIALPPFPPHLLLTVPRL
jgi:hypothetical protein